MVRQGCIWGDGNSADCAFLIHRFETPYAFNNTRNNTPPRLPIKKGDEELANGLGWCQHHKWVWTIWYEPNVRSPRTSNSAQRSRKIETCEIGRKHMERIETSQFDNIGHLYWQKYVLNWPSIFVKTTPFVKRSRRAKAGLKSKLFISDSRVVRDHE